MTTSDYLQHLVRNLPAKPGVYRMKAADGTILYVGKAKNLRNRVSSYFNASKEKTAKIVKMVGQIADIDYTEVKSDLEAIMLETNMIKEFRPKYNVLMKDDKNFVYIKITVNEDYPRIIVTRRVENDKARYFGPKTAQHKVIKMLKVLKKIFPFRHCNLDITYELDKPSRSAAKSSSKGNGARGTHNVAVTNASIRYPCLDFHIKRCIGPCVGTVSREEYQQLIDQVIRFLEGKHGEILEQLKNDMMKAAAEKRYELAARIRDKIQAIEDIMEKQTISAPDQKDLDVINYVQVEGQLFCNLFQVRQGRLVNQENFVLKAPLLAVDSTSPTQVESKVSSKLTNEEWQGLSSFITQYYSNATDIPDEILVPHELEDQTALGEWLSTLRGRKVFIIVPQRGRKDQLLELSLNNARSYARLSEVKWQGHQKGQRDGALLRLQEILQLPTIPKRIEAYDISHLSGVETVASMIVFSNGFPFKEHYRKLKLHQQTIGEPNDFASMEEALMRRCKYLAAKTKLVKLRKPRKKETMPWEVSEGHFVYVFETDEQETGWVLLQSTPSGKILLQEYKLNSPVENTPSDSKTEPSLQPDSTITPEFIRNLLQVIAKKHKITRIYVAADTQELGKWEEAGCELVRRMPEGFQIPANKEVVVLNVKKQMEDPSFSAKPDLIIIDGGKGQLSAALKARKHYNIDVPMISLAKKEELIFLPETSEPIRLAHDDQVLHLFQHIRDEAHRFALTYHQGLRLKASKSSLLDSIDGVGSTIKMKLLRHFGSVENLHQASMYEIEKVVGKKLAMKVKQGLGN